MAGMIAQHQLRNLTADDARLAEDDMMVIWSQVIHLALLQQGEVVPDLAPGERTSVTLSGETFRVAVLIASRLWTETNQLIETSWAAVERVAALMLNQDVVTQTDVDRLMQGEPAIAPFKPAPLSSFINGSPIKREGSDDPSGQFPT